MKRSLILALAAGATLFTAGAARASDVQWSIGINLPPIGTVISNGPFFAPPLPVFYPSVRYAPPPVYRAPAVVYRDSRPLYGYRTGYERPAPAFHGRDARWGSNARDRDDRDSRDSRDGRDGHDGQDRGEQRRHH